MPYQNRVNPNGEICYSEHRGTMMGNRGHLHNELQEIVRNFQLKRWIICVLDFKERKRIIMQKGRYTELFFLDEATALAAGHRPCAECQRDKFNLFKGLWAKANDLPAITTPEMDDFLHKERIQKEYPIFKLFDIPDGVMIEYKTIPHIKLKNKIYKWSFNGYTDPYEFTGIETVKVLTPLSIVRTISVGYVPEIKLS